MASLEGLTAGDWNVDPVHSTVGFVARHLMITKVRGRFNAFTGVVHIADDPLQSSVEADVDLDSVTTGDEQRDTHLRGSDFFDVDKHPKMTFRSTSLKEHGDGYIMTGDLSVAGETHPVDFDLEFEGTSPDPWGGTRAGFTATADINRKDWNLTWNMALETGGLVVGDKVKIELEIQAVKA